MNARVDMQMLIRLFCATASTGAWTDRTKGPMICENGWRVIRWWISGWLASFPEPLHNGPQLNFTAVSVTVLLPGLHELMMWILINFGRASS